MKKVLIGYGVVLLVLTSCALGGCATTVGVRPGVSASKAQIAGTATNPVVRI